MKDRFRDYRNVVSVYFYKSGFNSFSGSFDLNKLNEYVNSLDSNHHQNAISTLKLFNDFHQIHLQFIKLLNQSLEKFNVSKEEFMRNILALVNEVYYTAHREILKALEDIDPSTYNFSNTTVDFDHMDMNNPQPLQGVQEIGVEFVTLISRYVNHFYKDGFEAETEYSEKEQVGFYEDIVLLTNEYYAIKDHFESSLLLSGDIRISKEQKELLFDSKDQSLGLSLGLLSSIIENRNTLNYFSFQHTLQNKSFVYLGPAKNFKILDRIIKDDEEFSFSLRDRNIDEYHHLFEYEISIKNYYPYLKPEPLRDLKGLFLKDLIHLQENLSILASRLGSLVDHKKVQQSLDSIRDTYAPQIKKSMILDYLTKASCFTKDQVASYLELLENSGNDDFYAKPLISVNNDKYIFPVLPLKGRNLYYLIDHWLEELDYSLSERGNEFQKFVKETLKEVPENGFNNFNVVKPNNIVLSKSCKQEIDLIIELSEILIIGEIKCIKYPMSVRDCFDSLTDRIEKAIGQLFVKERFLRNNRPKILEKYGFDTYKEVVKVVIINYPVFNGYTVKGIPIIDFNSMLPYFNSPNGVLREFDDENMEEVETFQYYSSEKEFNKNLESYLNRPSDFSYFAQHVESMNLSYELPNIGYKVHFDDYRDKNFSEE